MQYLYLGVLGYTFGVRYAFSVLVTQSLQEPGTGDAFVKNISQPTCRINCNVNARCITGNKLLPFSASTCKNNAAKPNNPGFYIYLSAFVSHEMMCTFCKKCTLLSNFSADREGEDFFNLEKEGFCREKIKTCGFWYLGILL